MMTMTILLTPIRHHQPLEAQRKGDVLVLNGTACDLSQGETCDWMLGAAEKTPGGWLVTLLLPHGANAPEETLYPRPVEMAKDGPVPLPPHDGTAEGADEAGGDGAGKAAV